MNRKLFEELKKSLPKEIIKRTTKNLQNYSKIKKSNKY